MRKILQYRSEGQETWQAFTLPMDFDKPVSTREFQVPEKGDNWKTPNGSLTYVVLVDDIAIGDGWQAGKKGDRRVTYIPVRAYPADREGDYWPTYVDLEKFSDFSFEGNPGKGQAGPPSQ